MVRKTENIELSNGEEIRIIFTNRSLVQVEERLKEPIMVTAGKFSNGEVAMGQLVQLLKAGMEASLKEENQPSRVTLDDAYRVVDDVGFLQVVQKVIAALTNCISYGSE